MRILRDREFIRLKAIEKRAKELEHFMYATTNNGLLRLIATDNTVATGLQEHLQVIRALTKNPEDSPRHMGIRELK